MTCSHKKKCVFVNLSKDPLKPPKKVSQSTKKYMAKSKGLTRWRDAWFKGQYELDESE